MTAEDGKTLDKESREKPASHALLTLETLPNEIIASIAAMLAVDIDAPYVVSRPTLSTSATRKQEDANARRDLIRLCMVSKRIASNAQKALYRNVLITNANTLILLYRTFLENPELGVYVKQMSPDIFYGRLVPSARFPNRDPIDLSPLLSYTQHSLGEQLKAAAEGSGRASHKFPLELLFTLLFGVRSRTNNLESLDFNIHRFLSTARISAGPSEPVQFWEELGGVLCSLWEEISPCLSRLEKLQLLGNHEPRDKEPLPLARQRFAALIFRCFLTLPNLKQLIWHNHAHGRSDTLPFLMVSGKPGSSVAWLDKTFTYSPQLFYILLMPYVAPPGIDAESRYESVRTLELGESLCVPQGLDTLCSAFP
jgi:hypothetical protein